MRTLIVAKTHMSQAFCIGAYDMDNHKNIRLLTIECNNQPLNTSFDVGQIWEIDYIKRNDIIEPHTEDVLVKKCEFIEKVKNISNYLPNDLPIWRGEPSNIFNGKLNFPIGKAGFIERERSALNQSVGFWVPDKNLELTIFEDRKHYFYFGEQVYSFPFVGAMPKIETIPSGTLLRVSLARWWSPSLSKFPKRCYCQLSGWLSLPVKNEYDYSKSEMINGIEYDYSF